MMNAVNNMESTENDLAAFKQYMESEHADPESPLYEAISGIQYSYDLDFTVYTKSIDGNIILSDTMTLMQKMMGSFVGIDMSAMSNLTEMAESNPMMTIMSSTGGVPGATLWQEMLPGENGRMVSELLEKQYEVVYGSWPTAYNEIVLVLDENNELDDMTLYALGLKSEEDIEAIVQAAMDKIPIEADTGSWSYEEICAMDFRTVLPSDCYVLLIGMHLYTMVYDVDAFRKYSKFLIISMTMSRGSQKVNGDHRRCHCGRIYGNSQTGSEICRLAAESNGLFRSGAQSTLGGQPFSWQHIFYQFGFLGYQAGVPSSVRFRYRACVLCLWPQAQGRRNQGRRDCRAKVSGSYLQSGRAHLRWLLLCRCHQVFPADLCLPTELSFPP